MLAEQALGPIDPPPRALWVIFCLLLVHAYFVFPFVPVLLRIDGSWLPSFNSS